MKIKAIIFDMFGVVCSEVAPVWLRKYFPEEKAKALKSLYFPKVDDGTMLAPELFRTLADLINSTPEKVREEFVEIAVLKQDTKELIKELKEKYKIGLCSNSMSEWIRWLINKYELEELFDEMIISSEHGYSKPDKKIFEITLDKLSIKPEEAIFIDDNSTNVEAASKLGIKAVLFTDTKTLRRDLSDQGLL